jgi:hypothetical protein
MKAYRQVRPNARFRYFYLAEGLRATTAVKATLPPAPVPSEAEAAISAFVLHLLRDFLGLFEHT